MSSVQEARPLARAGGAARARGPAAAGAGRALGGRPGPPRADDVLVASVPLHILWQVHHGAPGRGSSPASLQRAGHRGRLAAGRGGAGRGGVDRCLGVPATGHELGASPSSLGGLALALPGALASTHPFVVAGSSPRRRWVAHWPAGAQPRRARGQASSAGSRRREPCPLGGCDVTPRPGMFPPLVFQADNGPAGSFMGSPAAKEAPDEAPHPHPPRTGRAVPPGRDRRSARPRPGAGRAARRAAAARAATLPHPPVP